MNDEELVEVLDKVPIFAIVDEEGNAAVVSDGETTALEFFLDARMASSRLYT